MPGTTGWGKTFGGRPTAVWKTAKQVGAREYRFTVVKGVLAIVSGVRTNYVDKNEQEVVLSKTVTIGEPFDFHERYTEARGELSRGGDGTLHFTGHVSVESTSTQYDKDVIVGEGYAWTSFIMSGYIQPFFIRIEDIPQSR